MKINHRLHGEENHISQRKHAAATVPASFWSTAVRSATVQQSARNCSHTQMQLTSVVVDENLLSESSVSHDRKTTRRSKLTTGRADMGELRLDKVQQGWGWAITVQRTHTSHRPAAHEQDSPRHSQVATSTPGENEYALTGDKQTHAEG
jgi:hypothetical protein